MQAKLKVGDWAEFLCLDGFFEKSEHICHILEINQQLCEAGIEQTSYIVRVFFKVPGGKFDSTLIKEGFGLSTIMVREMELGNKIELSKGEKHETNSNQ